MPSCNIYVFCYNIENNAEIIILDTTIEYLDITTEYIRWFSSIFEQLDIYPEYPFFSVQYSKKLKDIFENCSIIQRFYMICIYF